MAPNEQFAPIKVPQSKSSVPSSQVITQSVQSMNYKKRRTTVNERLQKKDTEKPDTVANILKFSEKLAPWETTKVQMKKKKERLKKEEVEAWTETLQQAK